MALLLLFADEATQRQGAPPYMTFIMLGGLFFLFWVILIRPQSRAAKEQRELANNVEKNDEVITHSGIYGTVLSVSEKEGDDSVMIRIGDNVKVKMMRAAIYRNLTKEKQRAEAQAASTGS